MMLKCLFSIVAPAALLADLFCKFYLNNYFYASCSSAPAGAVSLEVGYFCMVLFIKIIIDFSFY